MLTKTADQSLYEVPVSQDLDRGTSTVELKQGVGDIDPRNCSQLSGPLLEKAALPTALNRWARVEDVRTALQVARYILYQGIMHYALSRSHITRGPQ